MNNNNLALVPKITAYLPIHDVSLEHFLQAFCGTDNPQQVVGLRRLPPKDENGDAVKIRGIFPQNYNYKLHKFANPEFHNFLVELTQSDSEPHGLYFLPNSGGHSDKDITTFTSAFCENDKLPIAEQHLILDKSPVPTSIRVETNKSVHAYCLLKNGATPEQWKELMARIIHYFNSDASVCNPSRPMRLPFFDHICFVGGEAVRKPVELVQFEPERRYPIESLLNAFPAIKDNPKKANVLPFSKSNNSLVVSQKELIKDGERNTKLYKGACRMQGFGYADAAIEAQLRHDAAFLCETPLEDEREITKILSQALKYDKGARFYDEIDESLVVLDTPSLFSSWGEMSDIIFAKPEYLIYGVSRGDVAMFEAVTNYGKSSCLRNLAISLACGRGYLNLTNDNEPKRVMLLDYETSPPRFYHDIGKMTSNLTDDERELVKLNLFTYVAKTRGLQILNLSDASHLRKLEEEIVLNQIDVMILDTLTTAFSIRAENDNSEATALMKCLTELAVRTDTAILFAHHVGKVGSEEGAASNKAYRARGASSFGGMSAAIYQLDVKNNKEGESVVILKAPKLKDETPPEIVISIDENRWFQENANVKTFNASEENYRKMLVIIDKPMSYAEIESATPLLSKATRHRYLKKAEDGGSLTQPKKGFYQPYHYPFDTTAE